MTAIFTGLGAGFARSSANILGSAGQLGSALQGRSGEGVSVNAATGNLLISRQDEWLVGRGPDIGINRTYNSLAEMSDGDNNDQWQQSTARQVFGLTLPLNTAGSTIKRLSGDGSVIIYTWNATSSAYITTEGDGAHDSLKRVGAEWIWTDGSSQFTETYEASVANPTTVFRIKRMQDTEVGAGENIVTFSYLAGTDKLDKVTTADGAWTQYGWLGNNITQVTTGYTDLATSTAKTLTRVIYTYDSSNRLSTVTTDLSPGDNSVADNQKYVTTYTYKATTGYQIATISQSDGSLLSINYESALATARVTSLTQTVAAGDTRVTMLTYGTNFTTITGPDNQVTRMDYDAKKQLTKITAPPATTGATAQVVSFLYDASGNITRVTDPKVKATNFTYDANGNQLTRTDANANVVTRTFGLKNELLTETVTGSNAAGAAVSLTTRYTYDGENHLRYVVSAEGFVTEYYYDQYGQNYWTVEYPQAAYSLTGLLPTDVISEGTLNAWRTSFDNTRSKVSNTGFDARGNVIQNIRYGRMESAWGYGSYAEGYEASYYTYDQAGRILSRNYQSQVAETFVYDGLGRLIASTDLNGGSTTIVFNDASTMTTVTTASGYASASTYNKAGDLIWQTTSGSYDPSATTVYTFDRLGRVRRATNATGGNSYFLYDKAGRKTAEINQYGWTVEYQYDANNRIIGEGRYLNAIAAGHLTTLADPNNSLDIATIRPAGHYLDIWAWTVYDNGGRVIETIDGSGGATKFEYDKSDRLIKTTSYFNKLTQVQVDGFKTTPPAALVTPAASSTKDNITRSFYDSDGRMIGALDALGYLTEIVYDKAGQKVEEIAYATKTTSTTSATDSFVTLRGTVAPTAATNIRTRYVYDGQGLLRYSVNALGGVTSFVYNVASKLTTATQHAATIAITTTDYSYANIKALVAAVANATNDRSTVQTYDSAGRVATSTDATGLVTGFTYDNRGQLIKTVVGSGAEARTTRSFYTAGGDLRYSVDAEGYVSRFDYDADGRKVRDVVWNNKIVVSDATTIGGVDVLTQSAGTWVDNNYSYYANGELYSTWDGDGVRTIYSRFANGTLDGVYKAYGTLDQALTLYRYDGAGRVTSEYNAYAETEGTVTQYAFDGMGNRTSMTDANGKVTTYTYDKLGQMLSMADAAAGVTSYQYDAFGQVVKATDARNNASYNYYDNLGRLTLNRDAESYLTETSYTIFGDVASVTRRYTKTATAVSVTVVPTTTANAKDATTLFNYDKRGLVISSTDAEGFIQSYGYNAFGNRISSTAKSATTALIAGGTTTYAYDKRGQLISETLPIGSYNASGALVSSTVTNTYTYDARGNRTQMIEAAGLAEARITGYVYDKINRLIESIGQSFLGQTPRTYYKYDARGNLTETIEPSGGRTIFFYDDLNRKVVEINALGTYSSFSYDANSNITNVRVYGTKLTALPAEGGSKTEAPAVPGSAFRETVFTYDNLNRMLTSAVTGVNSYIFDGTNYVLQATSLTTAYQYDANGNVVKMTDANSNATFSYYDKLGRKTAQADSDRYLTTWAYDSEGNVLTEKRSANQATVPVVGTIPTVVADAVNDRTTTFIYDRNGNRTRETRSAVLVHNGSGATSSVSAAINYLYNGLGQVVRKTEATGDQINYIYDAGGRLTKEQRAAFTAFDGAAVTPTVDYFYNGIGNLSRTVAAGAGDAAARVTTYFYDGDKLYYMTDASGFTRYTWYDISGRVTYDYYTRVKSDGTADTSYNGNLTSYDLLGRVSAQWQADYAGGNWTTRGPVTSTAYNAYSEVDSISIGGVVIQQNNQYDAGGRLIASNAGDGIWKYFGYDGNGNQTVAITSAGANLAGQGFAGALSLVGQSNVNGTYTRYDARNLATTVVEEGRQLSATGALQTLTTSRGYNAFGEVTAETNANNATVNYTYNTMGRLIKSESPLVSVTAENGVVSNARPTEEYYYDSGGRLVASRDANGNLTKLTLLAGTGYGGGQAQVGVETHADGGIKTFGFDIHGDLRKITDETNRVTLQSFDTMGRVTQITKAGGLIDSYAYDGLGQRLKSWNNFYGVSYAATTDYDISGRVISQVAQGGDKTTTSYVWDSTLATTGFGTLGGWIQTTNYFAAEAPTVVVKSKTERKDYSGRLINQTDPGGNVINFAYNQAGQIASYTSGISSWNFTWFNTGRRNQVTDASGGVTTFAYDATGNIVSEKLMRGAFAYKDLVATYDALGRMTSWIKSPDISSGSTFTTNIEYDANGNVRAKRMGLTEEWFRYDSLNRLTTDRGSFVETVDLTSGRDLGTIQTYWGKGSNYTYDAAGNLAQAIRVPRPVAGHVGETITYTYDNENRLIQSYMVSTEGSPRNGYGSFTVTNSYAYDLLGRQISESTPATAFSVGESSTQSWNAKNQLASSTSINPAVASSASTSTYSYVDSGGQYLLGQVGSISTVQGSSTQSETNSFLWYDGAVRSSTTVTGTGAQTPGVTTYNYDAFGLVTYANVTGAQSWSSTYVHDAASQGIYKSQNGLYGGPLTTYRMGGIELYDPTSTTLETPTLPGIGAYTVRSGDTLQSIALARWGDGNLWYKIAEANGLSASSNLSEGQSLTIPSGVFRTRQAADTFIPYDAGKFIGDTQPTAVYPSGGAKCGAFGAILLAVIAVAVATIVTAGVASLGAASFSSALGSIFSAGGLAAAGTGVSGALALGAGVAGAVAGSVVSQAVGVATGIQDKFSWKGVALAGIGAGIGGALGGFNAFGGVAESAQGGVRAIANAAVRGALTSGLTQGVGVATGLQKKFDWAGVAAAGVGAGVAQAVGGNIGGQAKAGTATTAATSATFGNFAASTASGAIANAATRSAINGESFGQNLIAAIPDVLANILQRAIGTAMDGVTTPAKVAAVADMGKKVTVGGGTKQTIEAESDQQSDEIIVTASRPIRFASNLRIGGVIPYVASDGLMLQEEDTERFSEYAEAAKNDDHLAPRESWLTAREKAGLDRPSSKLGQDLKHAITIGSDGDKDIVLMNQLDGQTHRRAALDFDLNGALTIFSHGPEVAFRVTDGPKHYDWGALSEDRVVSLISAAGGKEPIIMLGCFTTDKPGTWGSGTTLIGNIATRTGRPVMATTELVQTYPMDNNGFIEMSSRTGVFRVYGHNAKMSDFGITLSKGEYVKGFRYNPATKETFVIQANQGTPDAYRYVRWNLKR